MSSPSSSEVPGSAALPLYRINYDTYPCEDASSGRCSCGLLRLRQAVALCRLEDKRSCDISLRMRAFAGKSIYMRMRLFSYLHFRRSVPS